MEAEDPQISPDGRNAAFVRMEMDGDENIYRRSIWIAPLGGGRPWRLTCGGGKGDSSPRWSPSGDRIAFTSLRTGLPQIHVIRVDGGEASQATRIRTGAGSPAWSPDGRRIAFISRVNDEEADAIRRGKCLADGKPKSGDSPPEPDPKVIERIIYREGTEYRDGRRSHVYVVDADGRGVPRKASSGDFDHTAPVFHPSGRSVITTSNRNGDEDSDVVQNIVAFDLRTGRIRLLTDNLDACEAVRISPDGKHILYIAYPGEKLYAHNQTARRMPAAGGKEEILSGSFDGDAEAVGVLPESGEPLVLACSRGDRRLFRLAGRKGIPVSIPTSAPWIESFSVASSCDAVAFTASSPLHPNDLFSLNRGKERRHTDLNGKFLSGFRLSMPEEISFKGKDGLGIQGWCMRPSSPGRAKPPLAAEVHGGPHIMWGNSFWFEFQMLASNGYAVFYCNPRGSSGYGRKFKGMLYRNWAVNDSMDVLSGVSTAVRKGFADGKRLFLTGGSYGGYLSAWIIGHDSRFKAAVLQRGVYDMTGFYGCSDVQYLMEWEFGSFPWDEPGKMWRHSPLAYVRAMKTPVLIEHSENDFRAPINTAEELYIALKKLGREVRFVRYPREGHELSRSGEPRHRADRLSRIMGWFDDHDK